MWLMLWLSVTHGVYMLFVIEHLSKGMWCACYLWLSTCLKKCGAHAICDEAVTRVMCMCLVLWFVWHMKCMLIVRSVFENLTNESNTLKWCMINHDQWCKKIIKNQQEMPKDWWWMNHTCLWILYWMELNPLSCPRVVNIVGSISVVNNVISSFRIQ